jgi:hypothetical protein
VPLPETITVRYTEESAAYLAMTPVVKQTFQIAELVDMVVRVTGKDAARVERILRGGAIVYNGYRYSWEGFTPAPQELAGVLAAFPDDDASRPFDAASVSAIILEIGGGAERALVEISREQAVAKRLFSRRSPWDALISCAKEFPPRYEKYDHGRQGDRFRSVLPYEAARRLVEGLCEAAPRRLRFEWRKLRSPASVTYISSRTSGLVP